MVSLPSKFIRYGDGSCNAPVLTSSSLLIICNLTSGNSSFNRCRNSGRRLSIVASLPSKGASPVICLPSAARTCWEVSVERSRTQGRIRVRMMSRSTSFANPEWKERVVIGNETGLMGKRKELYLVFDPHQLFGPRPRCP
jgi:hypothetical protein